MLRMNEAKPALLHIVPSRHVQEQLYLLWQKTLHPETSNAHLCVLHDITVCATTNWKRQRKNCPTAYHLGYSRYGGMAPFTLKDCSAFIFIGSQLKNSSEDGSITIFRNSGNHLPCDTACLRRLGSSTTLLWQPVVWPGILFGGGFNKFSWRQRAERMGILGR
jgi:hypothetical protein